MLRLGSAGILSEGESTFVFIGTTDFLAVMQVTFY